LNIPQHVIDFRAKAYSFANSAHNFASYGFALTPKEILESRQSICRQCSEWDAEALSKTGRCRKCGCSTWAKLRMATERCPLGKWEAVDKEQIIVEQDK
jgi:predicted Zn-ribbon and HTH transcriptional regulator